MVAMVCPVRHPCEVRLCTTGTSDWASGLRTCCAWPHC